MVFYFYSWRRHFVNTKLQNIWVKNLRKVTGIIFAGNLPLDISYCNLWKKQNESDVEKPSKLAAIGISIKENLLITVYNFNTICIENYIVNFQMI